MLSSFWNASWNNLPKWFHPCNVLQNYVSWKIVSQKVSTCTYVLFVNTGKTTNTTCLLHPYIYHSYFLITILQYFYISGKSFPFVHIMNARAVTEQVNFSQEMWSSIDRNGIALLPRGILTLYTMAQEKR